MSQVGRVSGRARHPGPVNEHPCYHAGRDFLHRADLFDARAFRSAQLAPHFGYEHSHLCRWFPEAAMGSYAVFRHHSQAAAQLPRIERL